MSTSRTPDTAAIQLAHIGAFDFNNYGDLLFAPVVNHAIRDRLPDACVTLYSPRKSSFAVDGRYITRPLSTLHSRRDLAGIVIGGGDVIQTNFQALWGLYGTDVRYPHAPYRLTKFLNRLTDAGMRLRCGRASDAAQWWAARFGYSSVSPFIPAPAMISSRDCKVIYNAVGVGALADNCDRATLATVADCVSRADYISVRDQESAQQLRAIGVTRPIQVVPDVALAIGRTFLPSDISAHGRSLLEAKGLDLRRPTLCIHAIPHESSARGQFIEALQLFRRTRKANIVLVPVRSWTHDLWRMEELAQSLTGVTLFRRYLPPRSIAAIFAVSDFAITGGLHTLVTAIAYGRPVRALPTSSSKIIGLLAQLGLDDLRIATGDVLAGVQGVDTIDLTRIVRSRDRALGQIDLHFDQVARLLS